MKILNLLKKSNSLKTTTKSKTIQTLDKKQLEKVLGGGDGTVVSSDLKASDGKKHFEVTA